MTKTSAKADSGKHAEARYIIGAEYCFLPRLTQR